MPRVHNEPPWAQSRFSWFSWKEQSLLFFLLLVFIQHEYPIKISWIRTLICLQRHWWRSSNLKLGLKCGGRNPPKRCAWSTSWGHVCSRNVENTSCSSTDEGKESPVVQPRGLGNHVSDDEGPCFTVKWHRQCMIQMMMDRTGNTERQYCSHQPCYWSLFLHCQSCLH